MQRNCMMLVFLFSCMPGRQADTAGGYCVSPGDCDGDRWIVQYDCDDNDPDPAASSPVPWYPDSDGDGHGVYLGATAGCEPPPAGYVGCIGVDRLGVACAELDCNDSDPTIGPCD